MNDTNDAPDSFQLQWHGNVVVVIPSASVQDIRWDLIEPAAALMTESWSDDGSSAT